MRKAFYSIFEFLHEIFTYQNFQEKKAAKNNDTAGLSPATLRRLLKLSETRDKLLNADKCLKPKEVKEALAQFYELTEMETSILSRWAVRFEQVKKAPDQDSLYKELDRFIEEIQYFSTTVRLSEPLKKGILDLCKQLPGQDIRKYDNYFLLKMTKE